jgi:hypothetical protein
MRFYDIPVEMRDDGEVLLLLPNLVPHSVSFHVTVFLNEIAIILFFAAITIWSVILVRIYYVNSVNVTVIDGA